MTTRAAERLSANRTLPMRNRAATGCTTAAAARRGRTAPNTPPARLQSATNDAAAARQIYEEWVWPEVQVEA